MAYAPFSVSWFITKRCNLTCTHCFNYEPRELPRRAANELDLEQCKAVVEDLADAGVFTISFGGGEVLSLSWFPELVAHCVAHDITTNASSNGALLTLKLAARLKEAGLHSLQFSIDGGTQATHDAVRGARSFAGVQRAIAHCRQVGLRPTLAFTLMKTNQHEMSEVLQLCQRFAIETLKLQLYIPSGRADKEALSHAERLRAFQICRDFEPAHPHLKIQYPCYTGHWGRDAAELWDPGKHPSDLSCGAGTRRAVIFEDGSVGGCEFMREDRVGDLRFDRIESIWNGGHSAIDQWRRLDLVTGKCGSCGYKAACGYGCRAYAYHVAGDFYGADTSCVSTPPEGVVHPNELKTAQQKRLELESSPKRKLSRVHLQVLERSMP
ncbi:MAG: radical SAM protein [Deltaproteobacteria bacterium]